MWKRRKRGAPQKSIDTLIVLLIPGAMDAGLTDALFAIHFPQIDVDRDMQFPLSFHM